MRALNVCLAGLGALTEAAWGMQQTYGRIKAPDVLLTTMFGVATNIFEGYAHTSSLGKRSLQAVNLTLGITSLYLAWQSTDYPNHELANEVMRILNISHLALTAADCFCNALYPPKDPREGRVTHL